MREKKKTEKAFLSGLTPPALINYCPAGVQHPDKCNVTHWVTWTHTNALS